VPAAEAIAGNQAALDRATAKYKASFDFSHTATVRGTDGQLHSVPVSSQSLAANNGAAPAILPEAANAYPVAANPYRADNRRMRRQPPPLRIRPCKGKTKCSRSGKQSSNSVGTAHGRHLS